MGLQPNQKRILEPLATRDYHIWLRTDADTALVPIAHVGLRGGATWCGQNAGTAAAIGGENACPTCLGSVSACVSSSNAVSAAVAGRLLRALGWDRGVEPPPRVWRVQVQQNEVLPSIDAELTRIGEDALRSVAGNACPLVHQLVQVLQRMRLEAKQTDG